MRTLKDQQYYNVVAWVSALGTVALFVGWVAIASITPGTAAAPAASAPSGPSYLYLTIEIDPASGMPQYSPANFTVPHGEVIVSIHDLDLPVNWSGCSCTVSGTVGSVESINGSAPVGSVSPVNVAHTFTVPTLGINVLSPGGSTVTFTLWLNGTGQFSWYCMAPCGTGTDAYSTTPMGTEGFMSGTLTVA